MTTALSLAAASAEWWREAVRSSVRRGNGRDERGEPPSPAPWTRNIRGGFMGLFMVYALSSWLTRLMAMAGYSLGSALNFVIVFNVLG
jgi:hypothetical protein